MLIHGTNTQKSPKIGLSCTQSFCTIFMSLECQLFCIVLVSYRFECCWNAPRRLHNHLWIDAIHFPLEIRQFFLVRGHLETALAWRGVANSNAHGLLKFQLGRDVCHISHGTSVSYLQLLLTCADFVCQFFLIDERICTLVSRKVNLSHTNFSPKFSLNSYRFACQLHQHIPGS